MKNLNLKNFCVTQITESEFANRFKVSFELETKLMTTGSYPITVLIDAGKQANPRLLDLQRMAIEQIVQELNQALSQEDTPQK